MRGRNKDFVVAGIKTLLEKNYKIPSDLIDVEAEVDSTLTFSENWNHIKEEFRVESTLWRKNVA